MDAESHDFFEETANCSRSDFKNRFGRIVRRLGLDVGLNKADLSRLYEAAFLGALCNIAFNGLGGCGGVIRPEKEPTRCKLERTFMDARNNFYRSSGWKRLAAARKKSIQTVFLTVRVDDENLAY